MQFFTIFFTTAALFSFAAAHRIVDSDQPPPRPPPPLPDAVSRRPYRRDVNPYLRARELYDLYERGLDEELAARDAEFDDWF